MKALFSRSLSKKTAVVGVSVAGVLLGSSSLALAKPDPETSPLPSLVSSGTVANQLKIDFNCGLQGRANGPIKGNLGVCEPLLGNGSQNSSGPIASLFIRQYQDSPNQVALSFVTNPFYYGSPNDNNPDQLASLLLNVAGPSPSFFSWLEGEKLASSPNLDLDNIKTSGSYGQAAPTDAFDLSIGFQGNGVTITPGAETLLGGLYSSTLFTSSFFDASMTDGYPALKAAYVMQSAVAVRQAKSDPADFDTDGNLLFNDGVREVSQTEFGSTKATAVPLESDLAGVLSISGLAYWAYRRSRRDAKAELQLD